MLKLCPSGYVARISRRQNTGHIPQACSWECHSYGNPMGNVPWDGMVWDRHKLQWDGNGTDKYVPWATLGLSMGMSFLWESHGKRPMGWVGTDITC